MHANQIKSKKHLCAQASKPAKLGTRENGGTGGSLYIANGNAAILHRYPSRYNHKHHGTYRQTSTDVANRLQAHT